jgi:hypothetical protein
MKWAAKGCSTARYRDVYVSMSTAIAFLLNIGVVAHESATGAIGTTQIPAARAMPKSDRLDQGSCWYAIFSAPADPMRRFLDGATCPRTSY